MGSPTFSELFNVDKDSAQKFQGHGTQTTLNALKKETWKIM